MEDLNKNQIILLSVLISFVTSIATGIMTTSLLMEAPVEVTNTINRVVEKTIETVVPEQVVTNIKPQREKEIQTVVVSEEDRVIGTIDKNSKSIVRIYAVNNELGVKVFYSLGVVLTKDGIILTDKKQVSEAMDYVALMYDGSEIPLVYLSGFKTNGGYFVAKLKEGDVLYPASISSSIPKLGQSVVSIGGDSVNAVSVGRISLINTKEIGTTTKYISSIETDIIPRDEVYGSPILSLSGDLMGVNLSVYQSLKLFLPWNLIKEDLATLNTPKESSKDTSKRE